MHILPPAIEIGENEGFNPQKDIFGRKAFGEDLKRLFENVEDPLVAILDAPWGSGKTVFAKMWCGMMRNEGFPVIYFDAFANDYMNDAFLCLASEIIEVSNKDKAFTDSAKKKFVECSKNVGKALLKTGVKAGIKALTLNLIDKDDLEALKSAASDLSKEAEAELEKYIDRKFDEYGKEKHFFASFRDALNKLVAEREEVETTPQTADDVPDAIPPNRPLIIVIDELDRCRPPFALELLEKIKHFFSVPGVHFLLVTHLEQLESVVEHAYGIRNNASIYLHKFYNVFMELPKTESVNAVSTEKIYIEYIFKYLFGVDNSSARAKNAYDAMLNLSEANKYSLRLIERVATDIALVFAVVPSSYIMVSEIVVCLCVIRRLDRRLYNKIKSGDECLQDIIIFFRFAKEDDDHSYSIKNWWRVCLEKEWKEWMNNYTRWLHFLDREKIIPISVKYLERVSISEG